MVKIAEYTRRDTFNATDRPGLNLNMPEAISDAGNGGLFGGKNLEKIAKGAHMVANEMVEMKNNFDKAKVDEYINGYMQNAQQTILGYKKDRTGRLADGLTSDFEQWSNKQLNDAMGLSEDSSKKPLLENREQIQMARESMDRLNLNYMNQVSSFQAEQIKQYEDNQATALITNHATLLSTEQKPENIASSIVMIGETARKMSQLKNQSDKFVLSHTKPIVSKALSQNVMNVAANNPDLAIAKMNDKLFIDNIDAQDYITTKDNVIKAFKEYYSEIIAEDTAYGRPSRVNLPVALDNEFFKDRNPDMIQSEIMESAGKKAKDKAQTTHENAVALQNNMILKTNVVNRDGSIDLNVLTPDDVANIAATEGGTETINLLNHIRVNTQNDAYNLENGLSAPELKDADLSKYSAVSARISEGYYQTIGEMSEDIWGLPSDIQNELLGNFVNDIKYKKDVKQLKDRGIDIEKEIKSSYSLLVGLDPNKNDNSYNIFRNGVIDAVIAKQMVGEKIDSTSIKSAAQSVRSNIFDGKDDNSVVRKMIFDLDAKRKSEYSSGIIQDYTKLSDWANDISNDADLDDVFDKESMKRFNDLIINGDVNGAVMMLRFYRKANSAYAAKKSAEKKAKEQYYKEHGIEEGMRELSMLYSGGMFYEK